jgi:hypothetical protein
MRIHEDTSQKEQGAGEGRIKSSRMHKIAYDLFKRFRGKEEDSHACVLFLIYV